MPGTRTKPASDGEIATAISTMVVRLLRQYTGRGPTRSRTYLNDELISVVLQDTLTPAEHILVANGEIEVVLRGRNAFQEIMRADLVAGVEALSGRTVIASFCDHSVDPDTAVESFLLAPQVEQPPTAD